MRVALRWASLATILALVVPVTAADYGYGKKKYDTKSPREKMLESGKVTGTLTAVDGALKTLTVQFKWVAPVQDPDVARTILDLQQKLKNTTDVATRQRIGQEILKQRQKLYSYQEKKENYDFQSVEDVKVRWKNLPPLFDDKGNPRKPNDKERAELKGPDKKSPGYQADFADLRKDMTVEVHVPKPNAKPAKGKGKDKDKDDDSPLDKKPQATMIIIVATPPK